MQILYYIQNLFSKTLKCDSLTNMNVLPTVCEGCVEATVRSSLIKHKEVREAKGALVIAGASITLDQP